MKLAAFPPGAAFLPALATAWLAAPGEVQAGLLILPNRRAARALAGAFLTANAGQALLLPRIIALAGIDETPLTLAGALTLPPAIPPLNRQALLAKLILQLHGANGAPRQLAAAWTLAADLATLLDDADYAGIDLATALPGLVEGDLAAHWQTTLKFLQIVTVNWPRILATTGMVNPAARQIALIDAQAEAWAANPPADKIWMVARDANPASSRLAGVVAGLPAGRLILPGYDPELSATAWEKLDDSHAQSGIARLLGAIGARREEIELWPAPTSAVPPGRAALLSRALLPAACLEDWQSAAPQDPAGLHRLAARDEQQDATAIAMVLREALETPGHSAALITPDRALALRVAAALARFGITANDSAGEKLADTPPAILLRLAARAAAADFSPLPLLALLKHPLTAVGNPPEITRADARALELAALRGPRPPPGLAGIRFRLGQNGKPAAQVFLARLEHCLSPLTGLAEATPPAAALHALITAAEALAATEAEPGAAILWSGEAGATLADLLLEAATALETLPDIGRDDLAPLLDAILTGAVIRRPRTRDGHPRIAIWGVQEAMLQTVDTAVLAGLHEGVWPAAAEPGPWLSRPMRQAAGLPSPELEIGRAAHDFFSLASTCPNVIFAAPASRERAPAVPARWLTRLEAMLAGSGKTLAPHPASAWAEQLDTPAARETRPKPRPAPPEADRPRILSISEIATLIADPYAIYARKILGIRELHELDEESDASQFGDIVHAGLAKFFILDRNFAAQGAAADLTLILQTEMRQARPRAALQHWWEARLARIAAWVVEAERQRRAVTPPVALAVECPGELHLPGGFTLKGRADRIETLADGSLCITDYKTGTPPTDGKLKTGAAPQLPLEAVMAEAGAFGPAFKAPVTELAFWEVKGRQKPGAEHRVFKNKPGELRALIENAGSRLADLFDKYADPATPYLAKPHPDRFTYNDTYAGISRAAEWRGDTGETGDAGSEESGNDGA